MRVQTTVLAFLTCAACGSDADQPAASDQQADASFDVRADVGNVDVAIATDRGSPPGPDATTVDVVVDLDVSDGGSLQAGQQCTPLPAATHETYRLPATTNLPSGVTFMTDWVEHPTSGGWSGRQIMDDCRLHPDGSTWHGKGAVRVEVDPTDDPLQLGANSERAEMLGMQDASGNAIEETASSGTQYYATSYHLPATWNGTQYPWSVFETGGSTWPGNVSTDCSANGGNDCASWSLVMQFYRWGALTAAATSVNGPQLIYIDVGGQHFALGTAALGKWTDLVFEVDWATNTLTVWRRDEGQSSFTQAATGTAGAPSGNVYLKQGLYRGGTVNGRVDVFWMGPTARGSSFAAVEGAVFGTSNGP